ncbi:MAG: hypothetical protein ACFFE6_15570, partial [Candidatus Thorarchaeota archaeon]
MNRKIAILSARNTKCSYHGGYRVGISEFSEHTNAVTTSTPSPTSPPGEGGRNLGIPPSLMLLSIAGIVGPTVSMEIVGRSEGDSKMDLQNTGELRTILKTHDSCYYKDQREDMPNSFSTYVHSMGANMTMARTSAI